MLNSINFLNKVQTITFCSNGQSRINITRPLEKDCFIRSDSDSCNDNEFIKWAREAGFLQGGLYDSICKENLLGKGYTHEVYKINGNDKYVIRIAKNSTSDEISGSGFRIVDAQDKNLSWNAGQCIARIVNDNPQKRRIEILLRQNGFANGNPPPSTFCTEDGKLKPNEIPYEAFERKNHYAKSIEVLANMPQSAYDELIKELDDIGSLGYSFDYNNPNNFLLDEENSKINIIDLTYSENVQQNDYGNVLKALSSISYLDTYMSQFDKYPMSGDDINKAFEYTITIIDKFTQAMINNNKKFTTQSIGFMQILNSMPMMFYLKERSVDNMIEKLTYMNVLEKSD